MSASTPDVSSIASLLQPFLRGRALSAQQLQQVQKYLELLLRWNARVNLTAVRDPAGMLTRHFGESFFLASCVLDTSTPRDLIDVGSGAGFPGLPMKIFAPALQVTLIESNNKKATFLKEVIRTLTLTNIDVFADRAERFGREADLIIMRAVEKFEEVLPRAAALVRKGGRLGLLIGGTQANRARELLSEMKWEAPVSIPQSRERVMLIGVNS